MFQNHTCNMHRFKAYMYLGPSNVVNLKFNEQPNIDEMWNMENQGQYQ